MQFYSLFVILAACIATTRAAECSERQGQGHISPPMCEFFQDWINTVCSQPCNDSNETSTYTLKGTMNNILPGSRYEFKSALKANTCPTNCHEAFRNMVSQCWNPQDVRSVGVWKFHNEWYWMWGSIPILKGEGNNPGFQCLIGESVTEWGHDIV